MKNKEPLFYCVFMIVLIISCSEDKNNKNNAFSKSNSDKEIVKNRDKMATDYTIGTYLNKDIGGWGFEIYKHDTLLIRQPNIPAIADIKGFKSEEEAVKVGGYVVYKLANDIFPPSLTLHELDSLKVTYVKIKYIGV